MATFVVSPYHLTSREPAALASALLAERFVTLLPTPAAGGAEFGEGDLRRAVEAAPDYLRLMESWSWAEPLFRSGAASSVFAGEDAAGDVRAAVSRMVEDPSLGSLRRWSRAGLFEDEATYLTVVARDVLRGGPDPGVSVPVAAGLDAFASRHGLVVARAAATSVAQKAEQRLARRLFAAAVPVLLQASGARLLAARAVLVHELAELRRAVASVIGAGGGGAERLRSAAGAYAEAFEAARGELLAPMGDADDPDEVRPVVGLVSLTGVELPADAVFRSSASAADLVADARDGRDGPARRSARARGGTRGGSASGAALVAGPAGRVVSVVVRVVGRR